MPETENTASPQAEAHILGPAAAPQRMLRGPNLGSRTTVSQGQESLSQLSVATASAKIPKAAWLGSRMGMQKQPHTCPARSDFHLHCWFVGQGGEGGHKSHN